MTTKKKFREGCDFGGWATRYNVKCSDGRTILKGAFAHMNGVKVPLVWQHGHNEIGNVLGHAFLEDTPEGVYLYGYFNETNPGVMGKAAVAHGDISSLSIYANKLLETNKQVEHGTIREASLVLAGANPGAFIDYIAIQHSDGSISEADDEAIMYSGLGIETPSENAEVDIALDHADDPKTVQDVFDSLNEDQKNLFYVMASNMARATGQEEDSVEQNDKEGDESTMKHNVFADKAETETKKKEAQEQEFDFDAFKADAMKAGSLKAVLEHAGTYGIGSDRTNMELLFPDAKAVTDVPTFISRRMEWVQSVLSNTKHTPMSRIKSLHADITADEARARGYVTGSEKLNEVFPILRRVTGPTTVYKKQKMDRDDVLDITDFDVIRWLRSEMRVMLEEELARAILVGDGRDPVADADSKINELCIRPIYTDSTVYVEYVEAAADATMDSLIDDVIGSGVNYRGSGNATCFVAPSLLSTWLLLRDENGHRLYRSKAELAVELGVSEIVAVPVMEGVTRTKGTAPATYTAALQAIVVNLKDYVVGSDKGGEITWFDDFDINFNQMLYLIETRISGALTVPKGAVVIEQRQA